MRSRPEELWIGAALGINLLLAAMIFMAYGNNKHGTETALFFTGRAMFLWFWAAYTGGALVTLFGATFLPMKKYGRQLGLAFAAALLVHLGLVGWLCLNWRTPSIDIFIRFGAAAAFTFLMAFFSFDNLNRVLGSKGWRLLRIIGMNYVLYAFFSDFFFESPLSGGTMRVVLYLPFAVMTVVAGLLRFAAWGVQSDFSRTWTSIAAGARWARRKQPGLPRDRVRL